MMKEALKDMEQLQLTEDQKSSMMILATSLFVSELSKDSISQLVIDIMVFMKDSSTLHKTCEYGNTTISLTKDVDDGTIALNRRAGLGPKELMFDMEGLAEFVAILYVIGSSN